MKTHIKYFCLCLLVMGLQSCEKDDGDIETENTGANAVLLDNSISVLDQNSDLDVRLLSRGVEFQSVEIEGPDGNIIADATISDSTATFNTSALGEIEAGDAVNLWIVSTLSNGEVLRQPFTVNVAPAITIEDNPGTIKFQDTTEAVLSFDTFTFSAPIDDVSLSRKINSDGTYTDVEADFDVTGDEIDLGTIDYDALDLAVGDTLYYKFVVESGALSEEAVAKVAVVSQEFGASSITTLSDNPAMSHFDLGAGAYVADSIPSEIMFLEPSGFKVMDGIELVEVTAPEGMTTAEYIGGLDLFEAEMAYEAGTKITSVAEVEAGNAYLYKVTREGVDYYGIISIGDVTTTIVNGEETTSFDLEYMEGSIIR